MACPLFTERLSIGPLLAADAAAFARYRRDPDVARYQSWSSDYSEADAARLVAGQPPGDLPGVGEWIQLAVRASGGVELLGDVAVQRVRAQPGTFELGVTFAREHQGHGYATEAVRAVLEELFTLHGAHRVLAQCDARNAAVAALLTRVGMRHEARHVDADWFKGEWTTLDEFALLAREWPAPRGV